MLNFLLRGVIAAIFACISTTALADKATYLDLAKRGWNYQLRTTMLGRDLAIPVHINGRDLAGSSICLVGELPHPSTTSVLETFGALAAATFGKPLPTRYAGKDARTCGSGRTVLMRLYSGAPPNQALAADLRWMSRTYELGLPERRRYTANSPAMAQTFFGKRGQGTHIMVQQPSRPHLDRLEKQFYKSILLEELFQSFTFGMDVLIFDRREQLQSKLQETPFDLYRLPWGSRAFMRALLTSNPARLCAFDVFMMHAIAQAPVDQTIEAAFLDYIENQYDALADLAEMTMLDPRFAGIVDPTCKRPSL